MAIRYTQVRVRTCILYYYIWHFVEEEEKKIQKIKITLSSQFTVHEISRETIILLFVFSRLVSGGR